MKLHCHKTTTFEEFVGKVESEWGEGKGIKYRDEVGDLVVMRRTEELMWVRERNKTHPVTLTVFSASVFPFFNIYFFFNLLFDC